MIIKLEYAQDVVEVKRVSARVMSVKLEIEADVECCQWFSPQDGCEMEGKETFWSKLDEVAEIIPTVEREW